jgi:hypothetical protein
MLKRAARWICSIWPSLDWLGTDLDDTAAEPLESREEAMMVGDVVAIHGYCKDLDGAVGVVRQIRGDLVFIDLFTCVKIFALHGIPSHRLLVLRCSCGKELVQADFR